MMLLVAIYDMAQLLAYWRVGISLPGTRFRSVRDSTLKRWRHVELVSQNKIQVGQNQPAASLGAAVSRLNFQDFKDSRPEFWVPNI